ncbi:MAG: hypothetical protein L0Y71_02065 [Gemmataceae bacterium]|nr:hypothetical protein [Gemmataceae bacterium]
MIPRAIHRNLARLRRRERLLALAWGASCWVAVVLAALLAACAIDWWIDRDRDTPWAVRRLLFAMQLLLAAAAAYWFLIRPQWRWLRDDTVALWVEERQPALVHRLITTVQLSRPGARSEGMSQELIAVVTREAEAQTTDIDFAALADHGRLRRAVQILAPALVVVVLAVALAPNLIGILVARQLLADVDIPHSVAIEPFKLDDVRPAGEKLTLQFRVRSAEELDPGWVGGVFVTPQGQPRDRYPLEFVRRDADHAVFQAEVVPSTVNLTYTARLGDGRLRRPGHIAIVPRPVVTEQSAWLQLPAFCGLRPDRSRYEQPQGRGDIVGIPGSGARLAVKIQKPVQRVFLQMFGPKTAATAREDDPVVEELKRQVELELSADGTQANGSFDLRGAESAYRIVAVDEYGFENVPAPRRGLRVVPEEAPQVVLLKEQMPPAGPIAAGSSWEDFEVDGLPIVPGKKIRVGYVAQGPYGVGRARFLYRIIRKTESGDDEPKEEPWRALDLPPIPIDAYARLGAFDPKRGAFEHSGLGDTIYFHAVPSPDPDKLLGRTLAGGRFDFATAGIADGQGGLVTLRVGDQLEFCVEVFADEDPRSKRPSARSDMRTRPILSDDEFARWFVDALQEEQRLKELDGRQRGVFELR